MKRVRTPITKEDVEKLKAADEVLFSGVIYTARDQAHKRLVELIKNNKEMPFDLKGQIIYYCGPTATPKDKVIGSCGPTTSWRMDGFLEPLLRKGLLGMIGKGARTKSARELIRKFGAVYFVAPSGCGALLAQKVLSKKQVCFRDLGPEAVYKLQVKDFPLVVAIDSQGRSIYGDI
ncbi:MAG: fumarate hydratase C-terminal domain-containing protein [Candidatus Omnitrophota bacterium]|nr:MAG: fumarate hydratase C-terminal domain-containing protein [Candidatus Omnitrophota bacterium]